jgi:hypothetical protein
LRSRDTFATMAVARTRVPAWIDDDNGGGYAAADRVEPAKDTGPPLGPLRPLRQETRAGPSLLHPARGLHKISHPFTITTTEVPTVQGD